MDNYNSNYGNNANSSGGSWFWILVIICIVVLCSCSSSLYYYFKGTNATPAPTETPKPTDTPNPTHPVLPPADTNLGSMSTSTPTTPPVASATMPPPTTPPTPSPTPPSINYAYGGNNGTINGEGFCKGAWGSADGKDKNMKCVGGKTIADPRGASYVGQTVDCGSTMASVAGGLGNWAYACDVPATQQVFGDNGSVSCDTYCGGSGGKPWNNELPVAWNGAKAAARSTNDTTDCWCSETGTGWK
jgi:hypothetical protein